MERLILNLEIGEFEKKKRKGKADPNGLPVYLESSCKLESQVVDLIIPVTVLLTFPFKQHP